MSLINYKVGLALMWSAKYVITSKVTQDADPNADPPFITGKALTGATSIISHAKLFIIYQLSLSQFKTIKSYCSK